MNIKKKYFKLFFRNKIVLGHSSIYRNPKMSKYILFKNKKFDIINPIKILKLKNETKKFLTKLAYQGGRILFVGTKKQVKEIIEKFANKVKMPYINYKWPAGLLTNINNTRLSIKNKNLLIKQKKKIFKYLSKKDKNLINRKFKKINKKFGTILNMNKVPDAIIIVDVKKEIIALNEAYKSSLYIIGLVDTDSNPDKIDYPIPINDDLSKSVNYILKDLTKSILKGLRLRKKKIIYDYKKK
ncbi:MAG: 30S ribosomal protein S2 [Candidatus Shikimatogenerans bostrichidophilus]|nr:MAG: 30S ribosomal protein S2 [Candidatus Shikimatogenerans bostrichidophilus]